MRRAELVMAICLAVLSLYLMWKSAELPIGWLRGEGPGGGAFPFWLSAGMFLSTLAVMVRWFRRSSPPSRATEAYMDGQTLRVFFIVAGSLTVMIAAIHWVGVYIAVAFYLFFYTRFVGRHSWVTVGSLALGTPVVLFFFFEIALRITLPKGLTEPWFYPLYDMFL